jgi:hypothetical protein
MHRSCTRVIAFAMVLLAGAFSSAQTTISTGSIQGTVSDPSGALVDGAKVAITNKATGEITNLATNSSGVYVSGALQPGNYVVRVEAKGFKSVELSMLVQVGVTRAGNVKLQVGSAEQVVEVQAESVQVNTEQATVQGVLTAQQIDNLPINGRNFLDLAQLEPGVQIQDGGNFDPTKNGFSSISFGGRFGRTARIEVDGIDVSDEEVGTTTENIPASAIGEFQIQQSSLDLSSELTSSGAVNVVTRSGTNSYHGQAFYLFRDHRIAANLPGGDTPFQRNQFGGNFGGPIIKDKLFFFIAAERTKQDLTAPVIPGGNFTGLSSGFNSPFRENEADGRLDWQIRPNNYHFFYRFTFDGNRDVATYLPNTFQPFANVNHNPTHVVGLDFTTGNYTHSIRAGYMKFRNNITDATAGGGIFNPAPTLELAIGSDPTCLTAGVDPFCSGPNYLAPQSTIQSNKQFKYDGTRTWRNHIFRFGAGFNHIQEGGFAKFLGSAPAVNADTGAAVASLFGGGAANPLNYPADNVILGNGQGFSSEVSAFGFPGGGQGPDNRVLLYVGDSWKVRPNLTVTYGLRYQRDTGRTDSDLPPIPCSQLDPTFAANLAAGGTPCTGNILDLYGKGLGDRVRQPNSNFGPQLGVAFDPSGQGKTVFRAGIGLFYENNIWNNQLFDRPARLSSGLFLLTQQVCVNGAAQSFTLPDGTVANPTFCGQPIGQVQSQIAALQQQYQAATVAAGGASNPGFIGNTLTSTFNGTGTALFAPNYRTPRSVQMNVGMQHEFRPGLVMSADYVRNVETHTLLARDVNHVGDARYLNTSAAIAAINATTAGNPLSAGCPQATLAGAETQTAVNCYLGAVPTASISDFASNGLDSGNSVCGGSPCPNAAFAGINPNLGTNQMLFPIGRSVYNGLQLKLTQNYSRPQGLIRNLNLQVAYSYSKYVSTAQDNDFVNLVIDNNNPTRFIGPNGLDRRHQVSFGGTMDLPKSLRVSVISHFYSPLSSNIYLPTSGNPGGIFVSDVTGDGSGDGSVVYPNGDLLSGTNVGAFDRDVTAGNINRFIQTYNANLGLTPAGAALVNAGIVTGSQLAALHGSEQPVQLAPPGQQGLAWLKALDLKFAWDYKVKERLTIEPNAAFYNVFNFANFDPPNSPLSPTLNALGDNTPGSINSTIRSQRTSDRIGVGTGVFSLGSPRVLEFGMRFVF